MTDFLKLDRVVAEKVMGECASTGKIPNYSTSISDAWLIVNKFRDDGFAHLDLRSFTSSWSAVFDRAGYGEFEASADTAQEAICLAAIKIFNRRSEEKEP